MLVLTLQPGEFARVTVQGQEPFWVGVTEVRSGPRVRVGFDAPKELVNVVREEILPAHLRRPAVKEGAV